jgi:phage virion morphogenesis protein
MSANISVNDKPVQIALRNFSDRMRPEPILRIAGVLMQASVERTFREQGSPAGSWPPLAASTLKRVTKKGHRQILVQSGRLKNSITTVVSGNRLTIGTNLKYAAIHQKSGFAGRKGPFKKKDGKRPFIPARPYLVFRPEDPDRIRAGAQAYVDAQAKAEGLQN